MEPENSNAFQKDQDDRKRRSLKTPLIIFIALFGMSAFLNIVFLITIGTMAIGAADTGMAEILIDGEETEYEKILLLRVNGVIVREGGFSGGTDSRLYVKERLEHARDELSMYKGVLLLVNSPGGGVTESDEILTMIRAFRKETGKPVVAYFQNVAASGGYYIAAACDEIIAHPTTITGSIGVIMTFFQAEALMNKIGVKSNVIVSEKTPFKDIGSPFRQMKETEKAMLQKMVEEIYSRFVDVVAEGRKNLSREEVLELATGMVYSGTEAFNRKLVDRVGSFEDAAGAVRRLAKSPDAKIVELRSRPGLIRSILSSKSRDINLDPFSFSSLRERYNGLPMYLWFPGRGESKSE